MSDREQLAEQVAVVQFADTEQSIELHSLRQQPFKRCRELREFPHRLVCRHGERDRLAAELRRISEAIGAVVSGLEDAGQLILLIDSRGLHDERVVLDERVVGEDDPDEADGDDAGDGGSSDAAVGDDADAMRSRRGLRHSTVIFSTRKSFWSVSHCTDSLPCSKSHTTVLPTPASFASWI